MKNIILLFLILLAFQSASAQTVIFDNLLQSHVTKEGVVDYKNFDGKNLKKYLNYLEKTPPNNSWSTNQQKAFWINTYNAYTIYLILHAKHTKELKNSILDINRKGKTAWQIPFVKVGDKTYTLDFIEHQILRKKFFDPRIHVAVNCASISCPKLANKAFTEENIETELTKLMNNFINDTSKNKISANKIEISAIFDWFQEDFTKKGSIIDFLNTYTNNKIQPNAEISYLNYNWALNSN